MLVLLLVCLLGMSLSHGSTVVAACCSLAGTRGCVCTCKAWHSCCAGLGCRCTSHHSYFTQTQNTWARPLPEPPAFPLPQVRTFMTEQFAQSGLQLHSECNPVEVKKQADGRLTCVIKRADGSTEEIKDSDAVMMATGRVPKVKGLGLEVRGRLPGH